MNTKIAITDLTLDNLIEYYNEDMNLLDYEVVTFDFMRMYTVEPLAMLLFSSRMRSMRRKYPEVKFNAINFENNSYASHMGLYSSFGLNYGKLPGEASGSSTYIPITKIEVKQLRIESYKEDHGIVQIVIEKKALEMSKLLCGDNKVILNSIYMCIREILRNIVEHSESETLWIAAQMWKYGRKIEIAILDEGVGVEQTLKFNPYLTFENEDSALKLSIEPSISGKAFMYEGIERGHLNGGWDHSGFGLYIASEISRINGDFFIFSGHRALHLDGENSRSVHYKHSGTAIRIKVEMDKIADFSEKDIFNIIQKGEDIAAEKYSAFALTKASAASKKSLKL